MVIRNHNGEALLSCGKQLYQNLGHQFISVFFLFNFGEKSRTVASQEVLGVMLFFCVSAAIKQKFTRFPTSARVYIVWRRNILKFISIGIS